MEISKKFSPDTIEDKWYQNWLKQEAFKSTPDDREPYTIVIPPPNVTGVLHMGHILNNTIQDVLIRRKRMQGYNACWVPGMDHASIATEAKVVKMLRKQGIKKSDLSREEFLEHAFEWKEKYGGIILNQLRKLGASCDWDRTRFTMDEDYYAAVIQVFCDLYEKGLIYRGLRMVNWDPVGRTALSDEEVIYKELDGKLYHVRYQVAGSDDEWVTIATTRPETILGDTAITVHPEDERYQHLVGKKVLVPLINRPIPIIADDYVDREFGTGCLKVTPAHDVNDYEIGQRHGLEVIDVLNPDGTMSEAAQLYVGEDRFAVRKKITKDLEASGNLVELEAYRHAVGHSERTDAVIEPRLSLQWWMKMGDISKPAYQAVMEDAVQLIPPKFKNTYRHWMENIRDWCISRQLWWGHQIPAYYLKNEMELPEAERQYFVAPTPEAALEKARQATGEDLTEGDLLQDPDVLDTWFSSWLWPFQVFKGITEPGNEEVKYYYPTNDLVTGPDILFFWVARMIIAGYEYEKQKPFDHVYLTGLIRDQKGRKMSKSLGNSPDALDLMAKYGADGVRVGILLSSPAGGDLIFDTPLDIEKEGLNSKLCEQGRNFANKIWNALRLVKGWQVEEGKATELDQQALHWLQARMQEVGVEIEEQFAKFRISDALMSIYKLIWDDFCSWYLELAKPPQGQAMASETYESTLACFEQLMKMLHPFMPFLTEEVWSLLRERKESELLCLAEMPSFEAGETNILEEMELMRELVSALRNFRKEKGIPNKEALDLHIKTPQEELFQRYQALMTKFANISSLSFVEEQPADTLSLQVKTHQLYLPVQALDLEAERAKLEKDQEYFQGLLDKISKKLSNERFVNNAPEAVVAKERKKQADTEAKLALIKDSLAQLG
jgi:valyl-tRNA synthetase